jgi:hypothetical protein
MPAVTVEGVLISGVYGSGKSSVAAEIAEMLERRNVAYAAIDLDWLKLFHVPGIEPAEAERVYLANVRSVVENVRDAGVDHLIVALAVRDRVEVRALERAAGVRLRVVRLEVPLGEVVRRLQADPISGRRNDLAVAKQWLANSIGVGVEDRTFQNHGSIRDVAHEIVEWLGWAH